MTLTQEQIDTFWRDGYLAIGKLFNDDEVAALRTEYEATYARAEAERDTNYRDIASAGGNTETKGKRFLQITGMCERSLPFRKLAYDARILDRLQDLMGPNIILFHDQGLLKPAFDGGPAPWHQDNSYWKLRPATLISCWMTLDDVDRENGAMQMIPGSHLTPVWHEQKDSVLQEITGVDTSKAVTVSLPAGGCMFHHCQTLHYTQPNTTPRQRRAYAMHFMQPGTSRADGTELHVGFGSPLVRARI